MKTIESKTLVQWADAVFAAGAPPPDGQLRSLLVDNPLLRLQMGAARVSDGTRFFLNAIFAGVPSGLDALAQELGPEVKRIENGLSYRVQGRTIVIFREDDHVVLETSDAIDDDTTLATLARSVDCFRFARPLLLDTGRIQRVEVANDADLGPLGLIKVAAEGVAVQAQAEACGLREVEEGRFETATKDARAILFGGTLYLAAGPLSLTTGNLPLQPQTRRGQIERKLASLVEELRPDLNDEDRIDVEELLVQGEEEQVLQILTDVPRANEAAFQSRIQTLERLLAGT